MPHLSETSQITQHTFHKTELAGSVVLPENIVNFWKVEHLDQSNCGLYSKEICNKLIEYLK